MVETQQMSGGAMMATAVVIGLIIWIFPFLVYWLAWFLVIVMFLGGLATILTK